MTRLKGMTWDHPRGYDPMVHCAALWESRTGIGIDWDKRSLQDFESYPVEELARSYDLIVIDHPHVGRISDAGCLTPLDMPGRAAEMRAIAGGSVGASFPSYEWKGRQWGFPLDAATQVLAWRPDLLGAAPHRWSDVLDLAREGRVMLPLRAPHSLMCLMTICGNLGAPCRSGGDVILDPEPAAQAWDMLREIAALVDPACLGMDPIAVFETMSGGGRTACVPLAYGYVSYAMPGFRPHLLRFADMAAIGVNGPAGSTLGGTGIAVSAFSGDVPAAVDFAYWIASGEVQRGAYAAAGGQPGHAEAWGDSAVNAASSDFYRATRATLDAACLRPRHAAYMPIQSAMSRRITEGLEAREPAQPVIADLNRMFRESF